MPRKFSEKYIATLTDTSFIEELGKEGFERKILASSGLKSPKMIFLRSNAFFDQVSHLGYGKSIKKGISFEEKQELKSNILNSKMLPAIEDSLEEEYKSWRMEEKNPLVEIRLANKDEDESYMEQIHPVVITSFKDLTDEVRKSWIDAVDNLRSEVIIQITEIPVYDSTGFVYVNRNTNSVEINSVYGLWLGDDLESFDVCFANLKTLEIEKYILGTQRFMAVKSGKSLKNVEVSDEWIRSYKLSQSQLKKLLKSSRDLSQKLSRSIEFSFGVYKNDLFVHDLKNLKTDFYSEEYEFSDNFFFETGDNGFKSDIEAISNLELPFFLRESPQTIEQSLNSSKQKDSIASRLKRTLTQSVFKNPTYKKLSTPDQIFQEEGFLGYLMEFDLFLKSVNNLDKASAEVLYNAIKQNVGVAQKFFSSLNNFEKEIILRLSDLLINGSDRMLETSMLAKNMEILPLRRVGLEIVVFKNIIEKSSLKDISLSLPPLRSFEELEFVMSILDLSELNIIKSDKSKLYVDLSIPSMLFEYSRKDLPKKYLLDGVVIDLSVFMKCFFEKRVFTDRDYKVAKDYLKTNLNSVTNKINKVILLSSTEVNSELVSTLNPSVLVVD